jgi:hypothetical protein
MSSLTVVESIVFAAKASVDGELVGSMNILCAERKVEEKEEGAAP